MLSCCLLFGFHASLYVIALLDGDEEQLGTVTKQLSETVETVKFIAHCYGVLPAGKCLAQDCFIYISGIEH